MPHMYTVDKQFRPVYLRELFTESVQVIMDEGLQNILYTPEQLEWTEDRFTTIMMDPKVSQYMVALKEWDEYSYYHSFHVFYLGSFFARKMNLDHMELFTSGCLIHDIGKLYVPQEILKKMGKLTKEEFKRIKEHTILGEKWLKENFHTNVAYLGKLIRMHHERLDGSGYPDQGMAAEMIPLEVRILMIIDVFSALTLERVYRERISNRSAVELLFSEKEKYDPTVLAFFVETLKVIPVDRMEDITNHSKQKKELDWKKYVFALWNGNKMEALALFELLSDGMRIEDIYVDIVKKSLKEMEHLWAQSEISMLEKQIASTITREILDIKLVEYYRPQETKGNILLTTICHEKETLPLKIIADTLMVNGWKVFNLECIAPLDDLIQFLDKHKVQYVGFLISRSENVPFLQKIISRLRTCFPEIIIVAGGQALVHQEMLDVDHTIHHVKEAMQLFDL